MFLLYSVTVSNEYYSLASCLSCAKEEAGCYLNKPLIKAYLDFIKNLFNELMGEVNKYSEWYTFKPNSSLKTYFENNNIFVPTYFVPDDLINAVKKIIDFPYFNSQNNSQLINLEPELQNIFGQWVLYEPDIWTNLVEHIDEISISKSIMLQNEKVKQNFSINVPDELIFNNQSSRFWLHPTVNTILTKNKRLVHSWDTLLNNFIDLCTTPNEYFTRQDESFICVNPNTTLSHLFSFKCFHINQCEHILKQLTRFIGKYDSLVDLCPHLKSEYVFYDEKSIYKNALMFIEDIINNSTHLLPISTSINL